MPRKSHAWDVLGKLGSRPTFVVRRVSLLSARH